MFPNGRPASHSTELANKARLGNPYQPAVSLAFFRNSNLNHRFDARPRWLGCQRLIVRYKMRSLDDVLREVASHDAPPFDHLERVEADGRYGPSGESPLHLFASRGDAEACRILIDSGAQVDVPGERGYTALHDAASQGHLDVVNLLIANGANPDRPTLDGTTLELAESHPEILALLEKNKKANPQDSSRA